MTSKTDASDGSILALYNALTTMSLWAILLLGALDILGDYRMSEALHAGFGFFPTTFALFFLVVFLSAKRQGLGLSYFPKPVWDYIARATTVLLVSLTLLRGYEYFTDNVLAWIDSMLGARGVGSYTSFWTLALLTALHWLDVHCPRNPPQYRRWFSYALFFSVVSLCLHQLSDIVQDNGHNDLDALSAISAAWLLAFAAFLFPRTVAYRMLFDPRAPKANIASASALALVLVCLFVLEIFAPYPGLALFLTGVELFSLPIFIFMFRPLEIEARIARGEIDEDGASLAFVPAPRRLDVRTNTATELSALERGVGSHFFGTNDWKRYGVQAGLTFLLAYGAILLSRTAESDIAMLWWAYAHLAFSIFIQKDGQYLKTLAAFSVAVIAANLLAGNTVLTSILLTAVNATEGALIGIMARTVFGVSNTGFTLNMMRAFTIPRLTLMVALAIGIMGFTAVIGSTIISLVFGSGVFDNFAPWLFGAALGMFSLLPLLVGLILEVGFRYEKLTPKIPYLGPLCILYALGVFSFYAFAPTTVSIPVPHIAFILASIPLVLLPSLQLAGALVFYNTTVYYTLVNIRWVGDGPQMQVPFLLVLVPSLITIGIMARHQYARRQRAEQRALDFAPSALITLDDEGRVLSISKNAQEWFEVDAATLYGKRLLGFFENKKALAEELEPFVQSTPSGTFEAKAIRRLSTGQELVFSCTIRGNQDSSLPYSYVVSLLDITKEHELEKEKAQLIDRSKSVILVQDMQWNTLQCSDAWVALTGYSREETLASDFHDFLHPEELERATYERDLLLEDGSKIEDTPAPYRLVTKSGDIKLIKLWTMLEDKSEGGRFIMTLVNVTELEQAREEAETYLKAGLNNYTITDENFNKVYASDAALSQFEADTIDDIPMGLELYLDYSEADLMQLREYLKQLPTGELFETKDPIRVRTAKGNIRSIRRSQRWFDAIDGKSRFLMSQFEDVTELLEQQDALAQTLAERERISEIADAFMDAGPVYYMLEDEKYKIVSVSDACAKTFFGLPPQDIVGRSSWDLTQEDARTLRERRWQEDTALNKNNSAQSIYETRSKDGRDMTCRANVKLIYRPSGGYFRSIVIEDITELEQQRRSAEELLNAGTNAYTVLDETFKMIRASEEALKLFGAHSIEDLNNFTELFEYPDEQRAHIYSKLAELPTGDILDYGAPFILNGLDGTQRTIKASSRWFNNPTGKGRLLWTSLDDVTDLVAARSFNEALLDNSPAIILTESNEFKIQSCSEAWVRRMGYSREETVGREFVEFFVPEQRDIVRHARAKFADGKMDDHDFTADLLDKHGAVLHIRMNARVDTSGGGWRLILMVTDITELEQQRRYTDTLLNRNSSIILTQGEDWKVLSCSQAWVDQLGYGRNETIGHDLLEFMHPEDREKSRHFRETKLRRSQGESVIKNTLRFMTKAGETRTIEMQSVIEEIDGDWRNILTLVDFTQIMQTQDQLAYMVEHDELTGLLSRRGMQQRFSDTNRVEDKALYVLDIDHFKSVNDSFGHEAGDALLGTLGQTMSKLSDEEGDAIRLGGEEFAVIRPWYGWEEGARFGETLRHALEETTVHWNDRDIHRTASIGFAPLHMEDRLTDVLHLADLMAREAKTTGRNQVLGATEAMMENLRKRGVFIRADEIQAALENGEMHYEVQPIWNMERRAIEGFEALIRWDKPDGTRVMPSLFIDLLYEVVREQKYMALKTKLRRDCLAKLSAFPTQYVSFNFTMEQLGYQGAAQDIIEQLDSIKDHAEREIVIEVSERAMTARVDNALLRKEMNALQDAGYKIALDDFGVESSNLNRLQEFPISIVKIDKALISNIATSQIQRATLRGLSITLKTLGTKIIVEGVETERQADILYSAGLHTHQGFLHARPMPPEDVEANLATIGKTTLASELSEQKRKKTRDRKTQLSAKMIETLEKNND